MTALAETLRRLGPIKLSALAIVAISIVGFFAFFSSRLSAPAMGLLYSDLSLADSAQIVSRLEAQAIPYEIRAGGTQIYAPTDRVLRLRMGFAEQGIPRGGSIGYEIFDRSDALGATSFSQNVNHLRALEGELARTIGSLGPVLGARVHLVLPKRELFSRERQEPTASVVLRLRGTLKLAKQQVQAIQQLVAAAVPGLKPGRVSVIDDAGTLLARGQGDGDESADAANNAEEMRRAYEQRTARMIEELLERSVGIGKVRAEVTAELDFDRIVTSSESFDPESQVVRSTQTVSESSKNGEEGAQQPTGVANNLPEGQGGANQRNTNQSQRSEETINYEINKIVKNHVREIGSVRRMSVAVLVDGVVTKGADGARAYAPRPPEEMERLTAIVRSAIGFDAKRGDSVEVANLQFAQVEEQGEGPRSMLPFDLTKDDIFRLTEVLALAIVAILVILLVARPLVSQLFRLAAASVPTPAAAGAAAGAPGQQMLSDQSLAHPALTAAAGAAGGVAAPTAPSELDQMIDIDRVEGRVRASSVKKIGEIVDKHPDEAVAIVRNWMYQET